MPMRILLVAAVTAAAMNAGVNAGATHPHPVRSGTITGWGVTWVAMFNGEARDCQWSEWRTGANPECAAWLKSGCSPRLAGRDPAVTASIENVAAIADGTTQRIFEWNAFSYPGWSVGGGVVIQLWRRDCTEIESRKWRSVTWSSDGHSINRRRKSFTIPRSAAWMTVTTNDTANLRWTLT